MSCGGPACKWQLRLAEEDKGVVGRQRQCVLAGVAEEPTPKAMQNPFLLRLHGRAQQGGQTVGEILEEEDPAVAVAARLKRNKFFRQQIVEIPTTVHLVPSTFTSIFCPR